VQVNYAVFAVWHHSDNETNPDQLDNLHPDSIHLIGQRRLGQSPPFTPTENITLIPDFQHQLGLFVAVLAEFR
jgi:hypothetical protein